jgi:hypothetical protein
MTATTSSVVWSMMTTSTPAMPASPGSCTPSPSVSYQTVSPSVTVSVPGP